jgi:hypothetical protein
MMIMWGPGNQNAIGLPRRQPSGYAIGNHINPKMIVLPSGNQPSLLLPISGGRKGSIQGAGVMA